MLWKYLQSQLNLWLDGVESLHLVAEDCGDHKGEENGQKGGVGHQADTDWVEKEMNGMGLAVEEFPFNNDSNYSEGERKEDTGKDCEGTVSNSDLLTEEWSFDGQVSLQLHQDKGH